MTQLIIFCNNVAVIICSVFILFSFLHTGRTPSQLTCCPSFLCRWQWPYDRLWSKNYEGRSVGGLLGKMFVPDKKERDLFLPESMILGTAPLSCNYEEGDKPRVTEQSKEKRSASYLRQNNDDNNI